MTEFRPTRFEILPTVIKNLLIINVLFFLAQNTIGQSTFINMEDVLALHHIKSPLFRPWQIITHLFLHGNLGHLFANMFALWMFGSILENIWGPKRFLTFYFLCGVGAALIQLASLWWQYHELLNHFVNVRMNPSPDNVFAFYREHGISGNEARRMLDMYVRDPSNVQYVRSVLADISNSTYAVINTSTIGASGAVFGILAAFIYLFPNNLIYLYFLFPIKAKWIGLVYFGSEIYLALVRNPGDNIAHWAHLGGGLVGFLLVLTWNKRSQRPTL